MPSTDAKFVVSILRRRVGSDVAWMVMDFLETDTLFAIRKLVKVSYFIDHWRIVARACERKKRITFVGVPAQQTQYGWTGYLFEHVVIADGASNWNCLRLWHAKRRGA